MPRLFLLRWNNKSIKTHYFLYVAILLFWLKSYGTFRFEFDLNLENIWQELILVMTPLSSAIFFFAFSLFFKGTAHRVSIVIINGLLTLLLYANILYQRFFNDFLTFPDLFQVDQAGDLAGSAWRLTAGYDALFWLDFLIILGLAFFLKDYKPPKPTVSKRLCFFALACLIFLVNLSFADTQRPQLLIRAFDRAKLVKLLGLYNYHVYDIVVNIRASTQKALAESSDAVRVKNYVRAHDMEPNDRFFGAAKGKNLILVSLESTQNFLIDYELHGEEVTPFLNQLKSDVFYFNNFYHNTGQGKTSDAEFLIDNSLYPLPRGAVYTTHEHNEYHALPEILGDHNYTSVVFHGNNKSFWNRDIMYETLGYDHFYAESYYYVQPENSINYGIKDIPFFKQSMSMLTKLKQPFYAKFITLTNHYPFLLNPVDTTIPPAYTKDRIVNNYFQTARYLDQAINVFFNQLKASGLYKDSVIVLYGDHYGISNNHNKAMAKILDVKKITPYDHIQLQRVPLFIHIPGMDGVKSRVMTTVGGQIDLKPTLLHLLGIRTNKDIAFGTDLFISERPDFTIMRNGSFVSEQLIYNVSAEACYRKPKGIKVKAKQCKPLKHEARQELRLSDKVIYGDLLRFIYPEPNQ